MTSVMPRLSAVVLPGTGSDEIFVRSVFARPLAALGIELIAPPPPKGADVVTGSPRLLDEIAGTFEGPLLVGGISLGAHLATEWALRRQDRCAGVLVALPAWNGAADAAPAAVAAGGCADLVAREGLAAALEVATSGVAPWLAAELTRAWRRHGEQLAASLRAASLHPAPELTRLPQLRVPVGIAACTDDPVHPVAVARAWQQALPNAALLETTLRAVGVDRQVLGEAAVRAWLQARRS